MLPPSSPEVRLPAITAGVFMQGTMITRPVTYSASSSLDSLSSEVMPSYSSPWLPPVSSAVGPSPFLTTVTGIITAPQAESSTEMGSLRKPCWTPSASKSTVALTGLGRLVIIENSLFCRSKQSLGAVPAIGLQGGAVNPSLGATDAIPGIGPPYRPIPGAPHCEIGRASCRERG